MIEAPGTTIAQEAPQRHAPLLVRAFRSPGAAVQALRAQWMLRRCNAVPRSVRVRGRVIVTNYGRIELAESVRFDATVVPVELAAVGGSISIGPRTYINYGSSISASAAVSIGRDCLIGTYVLVMDNDFHDVQDRSQSGKSAPIVIEDEVWLGARVTVLKGVRIGHGAVIAAGAVVTKDVPPRTLAAGVPAKVIRQL